MRAILSVVFIIAISTAGVYAALPSDVIFYMSFDDGAGNVVTDLSGNGNDGTIQGNADWQTGKYGSALNLDGATYVTVPNAEPLASISNSMSVGAWVQPGVLEGWRNIVEMDGAAGWKLGFRDSAFVFTTYHVKDFIGQTTIDVGQWSHVAATWDGTQTTIYINGEPDSGGPIAGGGAIDVSG
ncbi:LamG domain-containing protein, partial [Candidatus Poribacteria bacterium]|nr:LamG domain-containing protein [Candidatus Poribacteria bacterium]